MEQKTFVASLDSAANSLQGNKLVTLPEDIELLVFGDIHGDLTSLNRVIETEQIEKRLRGGLRLVFLGDYVDRGPDGVGVLCRVAELVSKYPNQVFPLRGNHEGPADVPASPNTIRGEMWRRFDDPSAVMGCVRSFMDSLYTVALVPGYAFLVHGFVPTCTTSLERVASAHLNHPDDPVLVELLWNDPVDTFGDSPSARGCGYYVGMEITNRFLDENGLLWVIRGHESYPEGYNVMGRTLTLHSLCLPAYNYPKVAYLTLPVDKKDEITQYVRQL
jgi:hypothetical protein